tara:strand:+ start:280 stop:1077 length:798 start_codon:yes stop_codon:yes gene_type:complete
MEGIIEILKLAWYGHEVEGLVKGIEPVTTAAIIGGAASLFGSIFGSSGANKRARRARAEARRKERELATLERNRQAIINPYDQISNLSDIAVDLSDQMSNPFANLGVATKATKIQMEETDIALANTLDLLASTGASAGGATALAQAAAKSKQGVAANIEQQEKRNEELRAQGEATLEANKLAEQRRLQNIELSEGQRIQQSTAAGRAFVFGEKERRETEQLNRKQAQITGQQQIAAQARADAANILGAGIGGVTDIASAYIKAES